MALSSSPTESFDLIVVGGGHAGCEAALTAARLGLNTALFSLNLDRIAWQPCNPAVGGPAKSQLVHEVDALGGVIGRLADATALQKRVLNASRGPAVWALRAQTDKRAYARQMLQLLQHTPNLALREAMVTDLEVELHGGGDGPAEAAQGDQPASAQAVNEGRCSSAAKRGCRGVVVIVMRAIIARLGLCRRRSRTPADRLGETPSVKTVESPCVRH